jgi:hypothetical protein
MNDIDNTETTESEVNYDKNKIETIKKMGLTKDDVDKKDLSIDITPKCGN